MLTTSRVLLFLNSYAYFQVFSNVGRLIRFVTVDVLYSANCLLLHNVYCQLCTKYSQLCTNYWQTRSNYCQPCTIFTECASLALSALSIQYVLPHVHCTSTTTNSFLHRPQFPFGRARALPFQRSWVRVLIMFSIAVSIQTNNLLCPYCPFTVPIQLLTSKGSCRPRVGGKHSLPDEWLIFITSELGIFHRT